MGWYAVNYLAADPNYFGSGEGHHSLLPSNLKSLQFLGCLFVQDMCSSTTWGRYFCTEPCGSNCPGRCNGDRSALGPMASFWRFVNQFFQDVAILYSTHRVYPLITSTWPTLSLVEAASGPITARSMKATATATVTTRLHKREFRYGYSECS